MINRYSVLMLLAALMLMYKAISYVNIPLDFPIFCYNCTTGEPASNQNDTGLVVSSDECSKSKIWFVPVLLIFLFGFCSHILTLKKLKDPLRVDFYENRISWLNFLWISISTILTIAEGI